MRTIFETNRWHVYLQKSGSTHNGNGWMAWSLVFRKVCGNGDDGSRSNTLQANTTE